MKKTDRFDADGWIRTAVLLVLIFAAVGYRFLGDRGMWRIPSPEKIAAYAAFLYFICLCVLRPSRLRWLISGPVIALAAFCVCGMAGYVHYHYQPGRLTFEAMMMDLHFWIALWLFSAFFRNYDIGRYAKVLYYPICLLAVVIFSATAADMIFHIWPRMNRRWSLLSVQLIYPHPAFLLEVCVFLTAMLMLIWPYVRGAWLFAGLLMLPMFMTLRVRGFADIAAAAFLIIYAGYMGRRIGFAAAGAGAAGLAVIGARRIRMFYFTKETVPTARALLHRHGFELAVENLPFGTGFGSFGSRIAQSFYSPIYHLRGLYLYEGLTPMLPSYACDTFWPMLMGEAGFLGFACYLYPLIWLIVKIQSKIRAPWMYCTACFVLAYEFLETTAAQAFSDRPAVFFALPLGIALGELFKNEDVPQ